MKGRRRFLVALGMVAFIAAGRVGAQGNDRVIEVTSARLEAVPTGAGQHALLLTADIVLPLTETLRDSVNRGLALFFQTDLQLKRPRWYWLNEEVVATSIEWRLSYHALTRQYRVATNANGQAFGSLEEALASMAAIRDLPVAVATLLPGQRYDGWVRMRLDTGRLPKPFQMTAITDRAWNPQSEWKRFDFLGPSQTTDR